MLRLQSNVLQRVTQWFYNNSFGSKKEKLLYLEITEKEVERERERERESGWFMKMIFKVVYFLFITQQ